MKFILSSIAVSLALLWVKNTTAQCVSPGCNDKAFMTAGTDPSVIEYDNIVGLYHATMLKESSGELKVWGASAAPNTANIAGQQSGYNLLIPTIVEPANGFNYTGAILKYTGGGGTASNSQMALLTCDGLYYWGTPGILVPNTIATAQPFAASNPVATVGVTGTNPTGLPMGVAPMDVKMLFGTINSMALLTNAGEVYVLSTTGNINGDGTNTAIDQWHKVMKNATTPLANVIAIRGGVKHLVALTSNGNLYTWGNGYLGNGTALTSRTYATLMTLPAGVVGTDIKMIDGTGTGTVYLLTKTGNLFAVGKNNYYEIGDFTNTPATSWKRVQTDNTGTNFLTNIAWISANSHAGTGTSGEGYSAIAAMTNNGKLWAWGSNSFNMLGPGSSNGTIDPRELNGLSGSGLLATDKIMAVAMGGHTMIAIKECELKFGYIGHKVSGSMGDGTTASGSVPQFNFANTAIVNICGAQQASLTITGTPAIGATGRYCNAQKMKITVDPTGGVLQVLSGPGSLNAAQDSLYFNGLGNGEITLRYTVTVAGCSVPQEVDRTLKTEDCTTGIANEHETITKNTNITGKNVTTNDVDPDPAGTGFTVNTTPVKNPSHGTFTTDASGNYTYSPSPGYEGNDTVIVSVCNAYSCVNDTLFITINPLAIDDTITIDKNTSVTVQVTNNDGDVDPTSVIITTTGNPSHGTANVNPTTGAINYFPTTDYIGKDTITYTVCSNFTPQVCDTAILVINVNDLPCLVEINGNDFNWNYPNGSPSPVTETMVQPAANGGFTFDVYELDNSFNMEINGTPLATSEIEFQSAGTPAPGINIRFQDGDQYETNTAGDIWQMSGAAATPLVRVSISATGTVSMFGSKTSNGPLYPLELFNGNTFNTITWNPNSSNNITVKQNVVGITLMKGRGYGLNEVFSPTITVIGKVDPANCGDSGTISITTTGLVDGVYDFRHDVGIFHDVIVTSNAATINAVAGNYDNIVIGTGSCQSANGVSTSLSNPTAPSQPTATVSDQPTCTVGTGTITVTAPTGISYSVEGTNPVVAPQVNTTGVFANLNPGEYQVTAIDHKCSSAPLTLIVDNKPVCNPTINNEHETIPKDSSITLDPTTNDNPNGGVLTTTSVVDTPDNGTFTDNHDGTYTYTPNTGYVGNDTIIVSVCNNAPTPVCENDTLFITVTGDFDINGETASTNENTAVTVPNVTSNDTDENNGNITVNGTAINGGSNGSTSVDPATGNVTYTPNTGFAGTDTVVVSVCTDAPIVPQCKNDTIIISVIGNPTINNEYDTIPKGGSITLDPTTNDNSNGGVLTTTSVVDTPDNGTFTDNHDGTYTYTPNTGYVGNDTIIVSICNNAPTPVCENDTIFITVTGDFDVNGETASTGENTAVTVPNVTSNDTDENNGNITVNGTPINGGSNGSTTVDPATGNVTYTPNTGFAGTDTVVVSVCTDAPIVPQCQNDTIIISVIGNPTINNEYDTIPKGGSITLDPTTNDNSNGGILTTTSVVDTPDNGTFTDNHDGTYTYTPNPGYVGNDTVVVSVCNNAPTPVCENDTIFITVTGDFDVNGENASTNENTAVTIPNVTSNDTDENNGNITVNGTPINGGSNGSTSVDPTTGNVTYTPNTGFAGIDTVVVSVCTDAPIVSQCKNDTIIISVIGNPIIIGETITTYEDSSVTTSPVTNNDNSTGGILTVDPNPINGGSNGQTTVNPDGSITYTPDSGFVGIDTVIVSVCNNAPVPVCENDTIIITVLPCINNPNADCDGDGVINSQETADGTDPSDPCSFDLAHQTVTPTAAWEALDCDNDGSSNGDEVTNGTDPQNPDTDGDGVLDGTEVTDGTDPKDPCSFIITHQTVTPTAAWEALDCDNDGSSNGDEVTNGTDPQNPDTDGDGVLDGTEVADGTDPKDPCSFIIAHQTVTPTAAWEALDCDNDGSSNGDEVTNGTDPQNPDTDGDGVLDGTEVTDGTDPKDPCSFIITHQTVTPTAAWEALDCDNDGSSNGDEVTNGTDPQNPDTDGDGVLDGTEVADGTNPKDPCSFAFAHQTVTPTAAWEALDCDNDGSSNGDEVTNGTDPQNPDTDGDGVLDGTEVTDGTDPKDPCSFIFAHQTVTPTAAWEALDCDGDGLSNGDEVTNGSDPTNPCDPKTCVTGVSIPNAFSPDGDGVNDTWVIKGIENYPDNQIIIYNRWGNIVYKVDGYNNQWSGNSNSNMNVGGDQLPTGTYFYVLDTKDKTVGDKGILKGYVYLKR